jgi:hypothetical protein
MTRATIIRVVKRSARITVPTDLERQRFQALAHSLDHAKARDRVVAMLDDDYPLTKEDKAALAVGIRRLGQDKTELMRRPTKHDRGRKPADDGAWSFAQAVRDVREFAAAAGKRQRDALDLVADFWRMHDRNFEAYRVRVIDKLHLPVDPPKTRRK